MSTALTVPLRKMPVEERSKFLDDVLHDFQEKNLEQIAKSRKVSPTSLARYLLAEKREEWRLARSAKAVLQADSAEQTIKDANDMLTVNKAQNLLRAAQWQLERLQPQLYGQRQEQDGPKDLVQITLNLGRRSAVEKETEGVVIEHGR